MLLGLEITLKDEKAALDCYSWLKYKTEDNMLDLPINMHIDNVDIALDSNVVHVCGDTDAAAVTFDMLDAVKGYVRNCVSISAWYMDETIGRIDERGDTYLPRDVQVMASSPERLMDVVVKLLDKKGITLWRTSDA